MDYWLTLVFLSLAVRVTAIAACWRRAPRTWLTWAVFFTGTGISLRLCDAMHWTGPHGWYVAIWIAQQIGTVALLGWHAARTIERRNEVWIFGYFVAIAVFAAVPCMRRYPGSLVEPVLLGCGFACLALGFAILGSLWGSVRGADAVLAAYLIIYALLSLSAPDYLTQAALGKAWSISEILCFAGWIAAVRYAALS